MVLLLSAATAPGRSRARYKMKDRHRRSFIPANGRTVRKVRTRHPNRHGKALQLPESHRELGEICLSWTGKNKIWE